MTIDGVAITDLPSSPRRELTLPTSDNISSISSSSSKAKKSKSKSSWTSSSSSSSKKGVKSKPNLLKVLREAVGKDFSRITIPVYFNEPLSFLQRVCEDVEHSHLLDAAADPSLSGSSRRAALVGAFIISHYNATVDRTSKPFNPLLGETFDYVDHERNVAMIAEQVSHHPPITALHASGGGGQHEGGGGGGECGWDYFTSYRVRSKFHGNTFEAWPQGAVHIVFRDNGDHFVYEQAHTFVNNIVVGSLWIDNVGTLQIKEITKGQYVVDIDLKRYSSSSSSSTSSSSSMMMAASSMFSMSMSSGGDRAQRDKSDAYGLIKGTVRHKQSGTVYHTLSGNWRRMVCIDGKPVWTCHDPVDKSMTAGYQMTKWAWMLNTPVSDATEYPIPKTDSRLRPDQRALEDGNYDVAAAEKDRLEKAQRDRKRESENAASNNKSNGEGGGYDGSVATAAGGADESGELMDDARWFEVVKDEDSGEMEWRYKGGYFKAKLKAFQDAKQSQQQDLGGDEVKLDSSTGTGTPVAARHWPDGDQTSAIF